MRDAGHTKGAGPKSGSIFGGKVPDKLKSRHPLGEDTILREVIVLIRMVTSQTTEMQVEGEVNVEEAVKEMLEIEAEEDEGDPFKGMNNAQVAEI